MTIYTSYFARLGKLKAAGVVPIGIALWPPRFFNGLQLRYLAPKKYMMGEGVTREQYIEMYYKDVLGRLNPEQVIGEIERLSLGMDAALLCFEKPGDFCHRHLFAEWVLKQTGLEIREWEPCKSSIAVEKPAPEKENTAKPEMSSLFDGLF